MLHQMAEDYEVDPVYVLDLYRHGKVSRMLDFAIRAGVGILLLMVGSVIVGASKGLYGVKRIDNNSIIL